MEEWKTLWWNTRYEVSNLGRVRNKRTNKILTTNPTKSHKRPQVWLWTTYFGCSCQYTLARLVYATFHNCTNQFIKKRIYHRDGDIMNCKLENLYVK